MRGSPGPTGPTSANDHCRPRARELEQQRQVELGRDDRPGEDDSRPRQRRERRVERSGLERPREARGVGDIGGVEHVARQPAQPLGERRRARQHEVGPAREALLGGAEAGGVDAGLRGDVVDAVVDDQLGRQRPDQGLGLGHVGPQDRSPVEAEPADGVAH